MLNVYIPWPCRPIRYSINGSVATSRAMPTPFYLSIMKLVPFGSSGFHVYITSLIIASCTPENIISKHSIVKPLIQNNMHADTFGKGLFSFLERLSYTKTN